MDNTSTTMIAKSVSSTYELLQTSGVPLLYLFLGIFFALFALGVVWRFFVKGVRSAGRAVTKR